MNTLKPSFTATRQSAEERRANVRQICKQRGIDILPMPGGSYRLTGKGVEILTTDLQYVTAPELQVRAGEIIKRQ